MVDDEEIGSGNTNGSEANSDEDRGTSQDEKVMLNLDELGPPTEPVDLDHLPDEIDMDFIKRCSMKDLDRLKEMDLTPRQRESMDAALEEFWAPVREAFANYIGRIDFPKFPVISTKDLFPNFEALFPKFEAIKWNVPKVEPIQANWYDDVIGSELRKETAEQERLAELDRESPTPEPVDPQSASLESLRDVVLQQVAQNERSQEMLDSIRRSTSLLAVRTEQEHERSRRLTLVQWLLTFAVLFEVVNATYDDHNRSTTITSFTVAALVLGLVLLITATWSWLRAKISRRKTGNTKTNENR